MQVGWTGRRLALPLVLLWGCVHEVRRTPAPSLLPRGKVAVVGEVGSAGLFDYKPGMTVREVLQAAGGFTPAARPDAAVLTRSASGLLASTSVHLGAIADGREPDFPIEEGDVIQVPSASEAPAAPPRAATPPPEHTPEDTPEETR